MIRPARTIWNADITIFRNFTISRRECVSISGLIPVRESSESLKPRALVPKTGRQAAVALCLPYAAAMPRHAEPRDTAGHENSVGEFARTHVSRLCDTLPPGPAVERLQNFCGRGWELLRTPTFARIYRDALADILPDPALARFYGESVYEPLCQGLARIIEQGIAEGAFRPVSSGAAARLIVSALLQQATWCNHVDAFGPWLESGCHRVVPETLSLVLGGLTPR